MNQQESLFTRIGSWFRGKNGNGDTSLPDLGINAPLENNSNAVQQVDATRSTFLRPWAKRDQAIGHLQQGFTALTDLLASVRENIERQTQRQDELLGYLAHLPAALDSIPESNKAQLETLKAIGEQIKVGNSQYNRLSEILEKLSETGADQKEVVDHVRQRVEQLHEHDQKISENLQSVGAAMQGVSRNSQTSAQVLEQMRDNQSNRDGELERILHRQNTRFTTMLAIAIFLSIAALTAVVVFGYMLVYKPR